MIKPQTLRADSAGQIELRVFAELRAVDGVEIIKNRAIRLKKDVHVFMGAPCDFASHAKILFEQEVTAERRITTATNALILMGESSIAVCCRLPLHRSITKGEIDLLRVSCASSHKEKTKSRDDQR